MFGVLKKRKNLLAVKYSSASVDVRVGGKELLIWSEEATDR